MVERSQPRPRALASPGPDLTAQSGKLSPSSSSSSRRATSTTPDCKHANTLPNRHDSHSPRRSTVTPHESPEMNVRPGRLKRRKPPSRQSSPESVRSTSTSPDHSATATASRRAGADEKQVRRASTQQASPSRSPPSPTRRKGKPPAADRAPSPSVDVDLDAASTRSASPDRSDDEPLPDDVSGDPETHSAPVVPAARQREIDAVISRLPPAGPRIEADTSPSVEVDGRVHIDEGFCDESLESHYQAFMAATEELRMKRRPYYRVRTPGSQKTSTVVQRNVVQKTIRMRRREPKSPAVRGQIVPASDPAVASTSSAT